MLTDGAASAPGLSYLHKGDNYTRSTALLRRVGKVTQSTWHFVGAQQTAAATIEAAVPKDAVVVARGCQTGWPGQPADASSLSGLRGWRLASTPRGTLGRGHTENGRCWSTAEPTVPPTGRSAESGEGPSRFDKAGAPEGGDPGPGWPDRSFWLTKIFPSWPLSPVNPFV